MLCRWDVRVYDVGLLMAALGYVLDLMGLAQSFGGFERSPKLYIKALVLKEVCKVSLRYAEVLSPAYFDAKVYPTLLETLLDSLIG